MKKITIIGGDNRLKILKNNLEKVGYSTDSIGLYENDNGDITSSQVIVLPVPTTKDKTTVFAPLTGRVITLKSIEDTARDEQLILCCNYSFKNKLCVDYGLLDSYALLNAIPTAEGAIKLAIENTDYTLWGASVLVIGYGRVGKILANRLKAMGCKVTVTARKPADLSLGEALGFNCINTSFLNNEPLKFDIIFNTVDFKVIEDKSLDTSEADLIIDLSSLGGLNLEYARSLGKNAFKAPGLPGIVAPKTAADILSSILLHIINSYN